MNAVTASKLPTMNRRRREPEWNDCLGCSTCELLGGKHRALGFTLIELMVTLTVAAILMGLAVPAFRSFLQNDRLMTQAAQLSAALYMARAEAVKQDAPVLVCASADGATCSNSDTWETGWIVVSNAAGATPIQVVRSLSVGTTLRASGAAFQIAFQSNGMLNVAAPVGFHLCDARGGTYARYLQVGVTGNIVASPNVGLDLNNAALACP